MKKMFYVCNRCRKFYLSVDVDVSGACPACVADREAEEEKIRQAEEKKRKEEERELITLEEARKEMERQRQEEIDRVRANVERLVSELPTRHLTLSSEPMRECSAEIPGFSNITPKGSYNDVVVFDLETTGLRQSSRGIVEIGAFRYRFGEPVEKFQTYINPKRHIPDDATAVNNITDDMVKDAPTIEQALPCFDDFVGDSVLVAHNLAFDLKFLYAAGSRIFDRKKGKYIDTLAQAKKLIKKGDLLFESYALENLNKHFGIVTPQAHSALWDAFATGYIFFEFVEQVQGGEAHDY